MSEDAPAEPIFANDIDERFPLPEKEEGELSDDDEERLEAGTSQTGYFCSTFLVNLSYFRILTSNSESEIDRTIAEVKVCNPLHSKTFANLESARRTGTERRLNTDRHRIAKIPGAE